MDFRKIAILLVFMMLTQISFASKFEYACHVKFGQHEFCYEYTGDKFDFASRSVGTNSNWVVQCKNGPTTIKKLKLCPGNHLAYCEYDGSIGSPGLEFKMREYAYNEGAKAQVIEDCGPNVASLLGGFTQKRTLYPVELQSLAKFKNAVQKTIDQFKVTEDFCSMVYITRAMNCIDRDIKESFGKLKCIVQSIDDVTKICKRSINYDDLDAFYKVYNSNREHWNNKSDSWLGAMPSH